jgi:hypothetical protein
LLHPSEASDHRRLDCDFHQIADDYLVIEAFSLQFGHFRENLSPALMIHHFHPHLGIVLDILLADAPPVDADMDILAKIQVTFKNFLESGQAGAMTIGLIFGYVIRGITK